VVPLAYFLRPGGGVPSCPPERPATVDGRLCSSYRTVAGTCGDLYTIRVVYGFPGDHYQCTYDGSGALVGGYLSTDNHPPQIAGLMPPAACVLREMPCARDAGAPDGRPRAGNDGAR
jgi:hypothetical protein